LAALRVKCIGFVLKLMKHIHISPVLLARLSLVCLLIATGCAVESNRAIAPAQVNSAGSAYSGPRSTIVLGKFANRTNYMRGIFSDGLDRLGSQAQTILITHLQQTGRFNVVDRENLQEGAREASFKGVRQSVKGADYAVTGDIVEFGRKETGDMQLYGILGSGKQQVAYAKVSLNIVNVVTSEVVFSAQGAGEFKLSNREALGFGGMSGYDATLNGKVLDLAVREAINHLVDGIDQGRWRPGK
jgi:curli biogenesis system outer membrane secretion channel CsgG